MENVHDHNTTKIFLKYWNSNKQPAGTTTFNLSEAISSAFSMRNLQSSLYDLPEQLLTHGVPFSSSAGKGSDKYLRRMTSSHSLSRHSALGRFINRKHDVHITAFWGMYIQVWVSPTALSVPGAIFCSFS